jgi:hypothetical protein
MFNEFSKMKKCPICNKEDHKYNFKNFEINCLDEENNGTSIYVIVCPNCKVIRKKD